MVNIVPLKNHKDSSVGKPHFLISCGQEGLLTPAEEFSPTDCPRACPLGELIHLASALWAGGGVTSEMPSRHLG